jgi:sarcosine oxidase gamma subunit
VASAAAQFFTGVTTQTVTMPVTSTLRIGHHFYVVNNSSGSITINSSGGNAIQIMAPGTTCNLTCILTSGTTAASWYAEYAFQSGSSTGTVNAGLINQLAWYAANGTAVSGLATANDSVLVTSAAGVPSLSTTLPTGLTITSPFINEIKDQTNSKVVASFTSDAAAINHINFFASPTNQNVIMSALGTDANIILAILGKGTGGVAVQGSTSGTPYAAGYVGEVVSAVVTAASATAYTTGTTVNITSLLVQPGKWIIHPNFGIQGTTVLATVAGVSTTSATLPAQELTSYIVPAGGGASARAPTPILSINISVATTYYLVVQSAGTGSMTMFGRLIAERIA